MKIHILDETGDREYVSDNLAEVQTLVDQALATGPYTGFARVDGALQALKRQEPVPPTADKVWIGPVIAVG